MSCEGGGVQRIFFNKSNLFIDGAVSATSKKSSTAYHVTDWDKIGGGFITPSGTYTGDIASEFDIKIVTGASANRYNSYPKTETNGNGSIENITIADATNTQTITATLVKKETIDAFSSLPITDAHSLVSVLPGAITITLDIDTSNLIFHTTGFVLPYDIKKGQNDWLGSIWDWDTKQITDDGKIPDDALRFIFAGDNEIVVYRQYKELRDEKWHYRISPTPTKDYKAGIIILSVSGGYSGSLTRTSPPAVENYFFGITLFQMLDAIQRDSDIVRVQGVISEDKTPYTGIAALDINLRTNGFAESITVEGRELRKTLVVDIDVKTGAPTETLKLECINNSELGAEVFSVFGDITGELPDAISNVTYTSGIIDFKVISNTPRTARADRNMGIISTEYKPLDRETLETEGLSNSTSIEDTTQEYPEKKGNVCVQKAIIGSMAINQVIIFTYTKKSGDCKNCEKEIFKGRIDLNLLGLDGGVVGVATLDPAYITRRTAILDARLDLVRANTYEVGGTAAVNNWVVYYVNNLSSLPGDIDQWRLVYVNYDIADPDPYDITTVEGVRSEDLYLNKTDFDIGFYIDKGRIKREIFTSEAAANALIAQLESEGQYILYSKPDVFTEINERFPLYDRDEAFRDGTIPYDLNQYLLGSFYIPPYSRTDNSGNVIPVAGHWDTPTNVFLKAPTAANKYHYIDSVEAARELSLEGNLREVNIADNFINIAMVALKRQEVLDTPAALAEWDAMWAEIDTDFLTYMETNSIATVEDEYYEIYRAWSDTILIEAGLDPALKIDGLDIIDGDIQADEESADFHWVADSGHLPAITNQYYYSSRNDKNGDPYITKEFGFAITSPCVQSIKAGDKVWVEITGTRNTLYTYNVGDIINIPVASETPLILEGGRIGDYLQRWAMKGSVDGQLADYSNSSVIGSETPYSDGGIGLTILNGTQPYELGDQYIFGIEDKQFQYRRDGGAWSANKDIDVATPVLLESGVSVLFDTGLIPSYEVNDTFTFDALQPYSYLNAITPNKKQWTWDTPTAQIYLDTTDPVSALLIDNHSIPSTAVIQIEGLNLLDVQVWPKIAAQWSERTIVKLFDEQTGHDKIRISFSGLVGETNIGWIWVGIPNTTKLNAKIQKSKAYLFESSNGVQNRNTRYKGKGMNITVEWENLSVTSSDFNNIIAGIDYAKENNEPIGILPHCLHTGEAEVVNIDFENIVLPEEFNYQPDDETKRMHSLILTGSAIYK